MRKFIVYISIAFFFALFFLCERVPGSAQLSPGENNKNEKYKNVFKPLDGHWKGKFYVYSRIGGQSGTNPQPRDIDPGTIKNLPLKQATVVDVEQVYRSESPYLQKVVITDTYTAGSGPGGTKKKVVSRGINKVENNSLICIVDKPDERVIHTGKTEGKSTIIWQRNMKQPLKIEYFKETVEKDSYTIVGWGYYGSDDPSLGPRTWFYGLYHRQ